MTPKFLEKKLDESLEAFRQEMIFLTNTHDREYLTKDDLEQIGRQVFYCLYDFKETIVRYARENDR